MVRSLLFCSLLLLATNPVFCFVPQLGTLGTRQQGTLQYRPGSRVVSLVRLRAQEKQEGKSLVDEVASKGIWQGGVAGEAKEALARVGWVDGEDSQDKVSDAGPALEYTREDIETMVQRAVEDETFADERSKEMFEDDTRTKLLKELVRREVKTDYGVELEDLLNPIKVVSLEKKIFLAELQVARGDASAEERAAAEDDVGRFRAELAKERKSIMMDWLKLLFRGQAALSILIGGLLAFDAVPLVEHVPIAGRAFGFWTMWLFTIPSLRAVKPLGFPDLVSAAAEKKALNLAFVTTPLATIFLPFATKDPSVIFSANVAILGACYAFYALRPDDAATQEVEIKGLLKYLDYGSGRERGARRE